jgi:hypothetical protein
MVSQREGPCGNGGLDGGVDFQTSRSDVTYKQRLADDSGRSPTNRETDTTGAAACTFVQLGVLQHLPCCSHVDGDRCRPTCNRANVSATSLSEDPTPPQGTPVLPTCPGDISKHCKQTFTWCTEVALRTDCGAWHFFTRTASCAKFDAHQGAPCTDTGRAENPSILNVNSPAK